MMEDHKESRNGMWDHIVVYTDYGFQKIESLILRSIQ